MIQNIPLLIISVSIDVVLSIIALLCNSAKSKKQKFVELAKIAQKVSGYICEAENIFGAKTGNAKLSYVLNKIQMECITKKVDYNEEQWKAEIEKTLSTPQKKE